MSRSHVVLLGALVSWVGCRGPNWQAGPGLLVTPQKVALALNDPFGIGPTGRFDPSSVPVFPPPKRVRPCCAFGMDLKVKVGALRIPGYQNSNIRSVEELGPHEYDNGTLTLELRQGRGLTLENDGLVYTCRGGFIDTAHIRDNADRALYLSMQIARLLPNDIILDLPDEGTRRRVIVKAPPKGLLDREGRWHMATSLAGWIAFQLSVWHEIVTWYGWESVRGFSEKVSAFSPEDLYSNVLGIRLAMGVVEGGDARSRDDYNRDLDAWMREALRRLGAVPRQQGRLAMKALDGRWWDARKELPDWKLVTRRNLEIAPPLTPWLVTDAFPPGGADPALRQMCAHQPPLLRMRVPERIGDEKIEDLVSLVFEFADWIPAHFPRPAAKGSSVTVADFPAIIEGIRREGAQDLGPGFDRLR